MLFYILIAVYMHNNYQKAPASPRTTMAGGAELGGHPGGVKGKGGSGRAWRWNGGWNQFNNNRRVR